MHMDPQGNVRVFPILGNPLPGWIIYTGFSNSYFTNKLGTKIVPKTVQNLPNLNHYVHHFC